jgi:nitroreductase
MTTRTADPRVVPLFVERWSPRAFDGTPLPAQDLAVILDAATLAPSAFNYQPWRFFYAVRGDANWDLFVSFLMPFNAAWAKNAGALVIVVSDSLMRLGGEPRPSHSHSFDAGAAWALLALQSTALGYHAHAMSGIEQDKIRAELGIPDDFRIEAAVAIGRKGDPATLPEPLRAREAPSGRQPVAQVAVAGRFSDLPARD